MSRAGALTRVALTAAALVASVHAGGVPISPPQGALTGARDLSRIYDSILNADFDAARASIAGGCGEAPAEACAVLAALATWWRIQLDPQDREFDDRFQREVEQALAATGSWTERDGQRAEAWFYLGAAYGARLQWRVLRGERIAAARDGARVKTALERAVTLDRELHDAYFGIGLYHYYADVAPATAKMLRWLLLLPGGDRAAGLREMLAARDRGALIRGEADYQLHLLYLWYERQPRLAMVLLQGLNSRHPKNPLFLARTAEVKDVYFHDHAASLDLYRELSDLAARNGVNEPAIANAAARLGMADQLEALAEPDRAIDVLKPLTEDLPAALIDAGARASLKIAVFHNSLGRAAEAARALDAALAAVSADDPFGIRASVRAERRRRYDAAATEAARLSIEGWRELERRNVRSAETALTRAAELRPGDPVIEYRLGRLWAATERFDRALAAFEGLCDRRLPAPPTILGASCYEAGRVHEHEGRRAAAIDRYAAAALVDLADSATRTASRAALERLR